LIYSAGGSIVSVPFDPTQVAVTGAPTKLPEEIAATQDSAHLSLARDGTLAYVHGGPAQLQKSLVIVDASGRATTLPAPARAYMGPRVSPDGSKRSSCCGSLGSPTCGCRLLAKHVEPDHLVRHCRLGDLVA
jgi:hypothetical protein